jgi:hypothetical protein
METKTSYICTEKEESCLIELFSRKGHYPNSYTGSSEDDSFRYKYKLELISLSQLFYYANPDSESYWRYELTKEGLRVQKELINNN